MNPQWRSFLESSAAVFASEFTQHPNELLNFGDAAGELQAAQAASVLVPLSHFGLIEAQGEEAKSFLHNQLTSDINHLAANQVQHSAWCTAKGRMLVSFIAWREGEAYQLALSAELQEAVQKRLQMYVLRAKVKLASLTENKVLLGLAGAQAAEILAAAALPCPGEAMTTLSADDVTVLRLNDGRFILATTPEMAEKLWQSLSTKARPAGLPVWHWLDIQAGLPVITAATREEFVPQMADFEKIGGVSFNKGCYPGQEIVARTQYLGKVKRHLFRVSSDQPLQAGDDLHSPDNPDQTCGKIVCGAAAPNGGYVALAVIQSNFAGNIHLGSLTGPLLQAVAVNP